MIVDIRRGCKIAFMSLQVEKEEGEPTCILVRGGMIAGFKALAFKPCADELGPTFSGVHKAVCEKLRRFYREIFKAAHGDGFAIGE